MDSKISESQRKYFARRINEEFDKKIRLIKQQEAKKVEELSTTNMDAYLDTLGIGKDVESFRRKEKAFENSRNKLNIIIGNLEQLDETPQHVKSHYGFYSTVNIFSIKDVHKYFNMKCNQLAKEEYRKQNTALKDLEDKRAAAVDYIYGMTKHSDLFKGLTKMLKGTDIKFQLGGNDAVK